MIWLYKKRLASIGSSIIVEMKDSDLKMWEYDSEDSGRKRISRKLVSILLEMKMLKVVFENQWMRKIVVSEYGAKVVKEPRRMKRYRITPLAEKFIFDHIKHCPNKYIADQIGISREHLQKYLRDNRSMYANKKRVIRRQRVFPIYEKAQHSPG
jgi:hypothetical protein